MPWRSFQNLFLDMLPECPWILKKWMYMFDFFLHNIYEEILDFAFFFLLCLLSVAIKWFFPFFQIQSNSYKKAVRRLEALENLFEKHEIAKSPLIEQKLKLLNRKEELTARIRSIKKTMRSSTALAFKDELKARKRVLRRLG